MEDLFLLGCYVASLGQRFSTSCPEAGKKKNKAIGFFETSEQTNPATERHSPKNLNFQIQEMIFSPCVKFFYRLVCISKHFKSVYLRACDSGIRSACLCNIPFVGNTKNTPSWLQIPRAGNEILCGLF